MTTHWKVVASKCIKDLKRSTTIYNQKEGEAYIIKLYDEGFSIPDIVGMSRGECSTTSIYNMFRRHNKERRELGGPKNVKVPYIPVSEFVKYGVAEVARRYNRSYFQVYRQFKAYKQKGLIKERGKYYEPEG